MDLIITRDVVQHIPIARAIEGVRKLVLEGGAKFLAMNTYPGGVWTSPPRNSTMPWARHDDPRQRCEDFAKMSVSEGSFYLNDFSCPPWNFPSPLLFTPPHIIAQQQDRDFLATFSRCGGSRTSSPS